MGHVHLPTALSKTGAQNLVGVSDFTDGVALIWVVTN